MASANDRTSHERYSAGAVILHWLIAALVLALIVLGWRMGDARGPEQFELFQLHKSLGLSVLLLTLARLGWRAVHKPPPPLISEGWQNWLARIAHFLFYVILVAMPVSGWIIVSTSPIHVPTMLFHTIPWPQFPVSSALGPAARNASNSYATDAHVLLSYLLYGLLFLHVAAALNHHFAMEAPSLARMVPGARPKRLLDARLLALVAGIGAVLAATAAYRPHQAGTIAAAEALPPVPLQAADLRKTAPSPAVAPAGAPPALAETGTTPALENQIAPAKGEQSAVPSWSVEKGSSIGFSAQWGGENISGTFRDWQAAIRFNPEMLDRSSVRVSVNVASASTGRGDVDGALPGESWFAAGKFPKATFEAHSFERSGDGRYRASGTLTMKGVSRPLDFSFSLSIKENAATMSAEIPLDRTAFGIGSGEFADTSSVPAAVLVKVKLKARRELG